MEIGEDDREKGAEDEEETEEDQGTHALKILYTHLN